MNEAEREQSPLRWPKTGVEAISDGVFAIAITLLVMEGRPQQLGAKDSRPAEEVNGAKSRDDRLDPRSVVSSACRIEPRTNSSFGPHPHRAREANHPCGQPNSHSLTGTVPAPINATASLQSVPV
jgi:hypothetical protein